MNSYESSDTVLHSDTIKSALYVCALQLGNVLFAKEILYELFVSSAFPFDASGMWMPRPLGFAFSDEIAENRKNLKKINFFRSEHFSQILSGERHSEKLCPEEENEFGKKTDKQPNIWQSEITQRVWMNNNPDSSTPFYLEKLYPKPETGLYFIAHTEKDNFDFKRLDTVMNLLGDNGFGLNRNLGSGCFEFHQDELTLELPENATSQVSLSLYRPENEAEIASALVTEATNYQIIKRGGWLSSPENEDHISVRKKAVMMFTEGSVFAFGNPIKSVVTKGKIEDLKPDWQPPMNAVHRDGRAIFLPYN